MVLETRTHTHTKMNKKFTCFMKLMEWMIFMKNKMNTKREKKRETVHYFPSF